MRFVFSDSTQVVTPPATGLITLADAASRVGADPDTPPDGLQHELNQAHGLIDGPNGRYGRCFREWALRATLHEWPAAAYVKLDGGSASAVTWRLVGESSGTAGKVRRIDGLDYFVVPDQPSRWTEDSVLQIDYTSGPEADDVLDVVRGALLRLVSTLWADRIDPGTPALVNALEAADTVLGTFNAKGL